MPDSLPRPWWMTILAVICLLALVINVPRDLFFAATRDVEVWFGVEVRGWPALATAPLHWVIFGVGAWAFWTERPWAPAAGAVYLFYAGLSHLIWSEVSANGRGWPIGLLQATAISTIGLILLRLRSRPAS